MQRDGLLTQKQCRDMVRLMHNTGVMGLQMNSLCLKYFILIGGGYGERNPISYREVFIGTTPYETTAVCGLHHITGTS